MKKKKLILVTSPPACGKTFISKKLAQALTNCVYLDKDTLIVLSKQIFKVAGSQSGRDIDKVKELGLTLVEPEVVAAPALAECPITLECKVMYKQLLDESAIPADVVKAFYPAVDGKPDMHVAYYGEIVTSYIVEE